MAKIFTATFMCLILLGLLDSASPSIQCYSCMNCNDPFDKTDVSTKTCNGYCRKVKATSDSSNRFSAGYVLRYCVNAKTKVGCQEDAEYKGIKGVSCLCDTDLCNGSGVSEGSTATGIMAAIAILEIIL